jgi:nucleoside 2-deoxyribosyltransferase
MVAILDGSQVDDGTAWEIGYAYARGLPVWGLRTDFRTVAHGPLCRKRHDRVRVRAYLPIR